MIPDPWRTRLIALFCLATGIAGWLVLVSAIHGGNSLPRFWSILLAAFLVSSAMLVQVLAQAYNRLQKHSSELEALQEEAWAATALLQVSEAVGSLSSLDDIMEAVVRITPILVGVDRCTILLWQDESQEFVAAKGYARQREVQPIFAALRFAPGDVPLLDELRVRGAPIVFDNTAQAHWIPATLVEEYGLRNLLAVPLRTQGEVHGAMLADYASPQEHFTARKTAILSGIADQAAMAIANARSHEAQREEAWVSAALLQVAQAFISSADLSDNIAKIARLTPLLAGVDRCMIFLWEKDRGEFVPYQAHGLNKETMQSFWNLRFRPGDLALLDEIVRRQEPVIVENAAQSDLIPPALRQDFSIQAVLAVPLISKGEMLGAFLVDCTECPTRFPPRKVSIVEGIAHQTAVAVENARLGEAVLAQQRMVQELRLATEIQASFLPESCPLLRGWDIAADWHAAREVGGDFYDFIPLGRDRLGLVIADVSDKGVPAALFMALSRTLVRASALDIRSPAKVLQHVNELIMSDARSGMFVTMFYGVLERRTGQLTYAIAGHTPPLWWRRAESEVIRLTGKGVVVGVTEEIVLEERQIVLEPGDIVVLYTDGVTEPVNNKVEEFGEERLMDTIAEANDQPCDELVHLIHNRVSAFVGDQPQFDDYTLVAVKRQT